METATAEIPDLSGFKEYLGVRVTPLGDDGTVLMALGHHNPRTVTRAFNQLLVREMGCDSLRFIYGKVSDAEDLLGQRWAFLRTECGDCDGDPECGNCREIKDAAWWVDYSNREPGPDRFPVTILDLEQ